MKAIKTIQVLAVAMAVLSACSPHRQDIAVTQRGDTIVVTITQPGQYLILPIEEEQGEVRVLLDTGSPADTWMDVRLARTTVDYEVPMSLPVGEVATVRIVGLDANALALSSLHTADTWQTENVERYRPTYHHTPSYGWMNDGNGMFYLDGEWHLCFQWNPYGSKWGNMHWGHAVSHDLAHWEELPPALASDTLGQIFSGSSVVDVDNTAGYGAGSVVALYTSASDRNGQVQAMAYSTDGGHTFTKYAGNPVLRPWDGLRDFRDPKVFWYSPARAWYMIVSADREMRFYRSTDLREWSYVSSFGQGFGVQPSQYECPDFVELPLEGDTRQTKWVMLMNVNPGCLWGGSATEYFVGDFDGQTFRCVDDPHTPKWLDYGKDHYATVCFSNTPGRAVALPWMSNWQYANQTPIQQYRGANGLPRELKLYTQGGRYYVAADVASEMRALRGQAVEVANVTLDGRQEATEAAAASKGTGEAAPGTTTEQGALRYCSVLDGIATDMGGAFEAEMDLTVGSAQTAGLELVNGNGEKVTIYLDLQAGRVVMDRTASGLTDFGLRGDVHGIERDFDEARAQEGKLPLRQELAINYQNDFAMATWAPLSLCPDTRTHHLDIWVDRCSVELFVDGGRVAMTNLVFPTEDYDSVVLYSTGGEATFSRIKVYPIEM